MKKNRKLTQREQAIAAGRDPLHPERKLVSRRDFLSSGVLGFGATVMLPSVLEMTLFARAARAGVVPATGSSTCPFLIFDCAGGAALPGNFPPMGKDGNPLGSYDQLGLMTPSDFVVDTTFGAPMAGPLPPEQNPKVQSMILAQLHANLNSAIVSGGFLKMGIMPANSMSDSQSNTFSPISLVSAAGCVGSLVQTGLGMTAAQSGGNADWGSSNSAYKPLQVNSADALGLALSYGPVLGALPTSVLDNLASALLSLQGSQAQAFQKLTSGDQFNQMVNAGYIKNKGASTANQNIDPRTDADAMSAFGVNGGSNPTDSNTVFATLALNAITGNSGPAVMTIGGCDYHDGTQTSGDGKDTQIGNVIASAVNLAYAKFTKAGATQKKMAFVIYTDGGIYSDPGSRNWRGDSNQHGLVIFGVLDVSGGPLTMAKTQVGYYNNGQVCDPTLPVANDPLKLCHAMFLNYLAVNGMADQYGKIIAVQDPRNTSLLPNLYTSVSAMTDDLLLFPNKA